MIIYKTTNLIDGKFYIGKDEKNNPNYLGSGLRLKRAIKKYGIEYFCKEVLEFCETRYELEIAEKKWIKVTDSINLGYNIAEGGTGGRTTPVIHNKGKTYEQSYGIEKVNELREKKRKLNLGKKLSEETKLKMKASRSGRIFSEETKLKMRQSRLGKKLTEETKLKISINRKKYYSDPQNRENVSIVHKGKKLSEEHKKKISKALTGKKHKS